MYSFLAYMVEIKAITIEIFPNYNMCDKNTYGLSRINYNPFSPLMNYNIICYNCNTYGHIENSCGSDFRKIQKEEAPRIMERTKGTKERKIHVHSSHTT
jgi:hypothetical protein